MRKFLFTAAAGLAIVSAGSFATTRANAMPIGVPGITDEMNLVDNVALCFYVDGWNGPGLYECGFRFRRGLGWHGRRDGFRDGRRGFRGDGFRGDGFRDGNRGRVGFQGNGNRGNVQGNRTGGNRTGGGNRGNAGAGVK